MQQTVTSRLALGFYLAVINLLAPPVVLPFLPFLLLVRKRRKTFFPRLGFQNYPGNEKSPLQPVWIHALSVGELLSCLPLIKELRGEMPARPLFLSVSTFAAQEIATEKARAYVDGLFYFPYDLVWSMRRCLGKIRPALFLLVETDIWPGFLAEVRRLEIPCFLLNARLSPPSFRISRILSALFVPAFNTFSRIYPQSPEEGQRFLDLGAEATRIRRSGNLKFDLASALPSSVTIAAMRRDLGLGEEDRVILAGSTHSGEETLLRSTFLSLRERFADLKLVLVPRHPDRCPEILRLFDHDPVRVLRYSQLGDSSADVIVVNRMGLLGSLYAVADVAFVGGSLVGRGGQNPIEPAAAGRPVLFGPDMSDFPDVSRLLLEAGGAIQVQNSADLAVKCAHLLEDRNLAETIGMRARAVVDEHLGASKTIAAEIAAFLSQSTSQPPPRALNSETRLDETR
jgi:3-deoxy-D-manno-octulosonic-acid transferase